MKNLLLKHFLVFGCLLSIVSCSAPEETNNVELINTEAEPSGLITITKAQFETNNMQLGKFSEKEFNQVINVNGTLDVPPENRAAVSPMFGGFVKNMRLLPGEEVKEGQVPFYLENPDYIKVQKDYLEAKLELVYLSSDFERQKELSQKNISSEKKYLKAAADYQTKLVTLAALKKELEMMGIDPMTLTSDKITSNIAVKAPISGQITSISAVRGTYLNPSDIALTITDIEHLHVELQVFEKDLTQIKIDQIINFTLQGDLTKSYLAKVYLINRFIDQETHTANIHGHLEEETMNITLAPGMFVEAELAVRSSKHYGLPEGALTSIEAEYFLLLKVEESDGTLKFKKVKVEVAEIDNGHFYLKNSKNFDFKGEYLIQGGFQVIQG